MTRRGRAEHRTDLTAKALTAHAKSLGCHFLAHDGTIDGTLWLPSGRLILVDWKSSGASLTPSQVRLVAANWRIHFLSTPAHVEAVVRADAQALVHAGER